MPHPSTSSRVPTTTLILGFLIWLAWLCPAYAEVLMRVGVAINRSSVVLGSSTPARVLDAQGKILAEIPAMTPVRAVFTGTQVQLGTVQGSRLFFQPTQSEGLVFINSHWYRGLAELATGDSGIHGINRVGLEDYVSSVIGSEMGHRFPTESLRAQAVATRSYALFQRQQRLQSAYDLGDDQYWQVYKGVAAESNRTQAAAKETLGQVLTYRGRIINAVFHSSSGGHTDNSEEVWVEALPYLRGVPDYDNQAPVFSWSRQITAADLGGLASGIGQLTNIEVTRRSTFGRALSVRLSGTEGQQTVSGSAFQVALQLRSRLFSVVPAGNLQAANQLVAQSPRFQIQGRGFGHGVGMSQWGAVALARQNWNYAQILAHYYRGATLAVVQPQ
ncbi:MAG: SpoIID/LytB domain-containing protein [Synechococcales cyanobacterium]